MRVLVLLCLLLLPVIARADEPTITITAGSDTRSFTRSELLARPDVATIKVLRDVTYHEPMSYRAVPLASLLAGMTFPHDSAICRPFPRRISTTTVSDHRQAEASEARPRPSRPRIRDHPLSLDLDQEVIGCFPVRTSGGGTVPNEAATMRHSQSQEDEMKVWMFGLAIGLLGATSAQAQVTIDVAKVSCQQFLVDKVAPTKYVVLWLSGYFNGQRSNTLIDVGAMDKNADKVEDYCRLHQQTPVMDAVKSALGGGGK